MQRVAYHWRDEVPHDSLLPPPPPPDQTKPQASPYQLHDQSEVLPPTVEHTTVSKDTHAHIDHIEHRIRQLRVSESLVVWDDLDSIPVASLPAFMMPDIERWSRKELEALRQRSDESISSFISYFRSLISALYDVEDDILKGLWSDSSPVDAKGKKPIGRQRSDVGTITSTSQRPLRCHQPILQPIGTYLSYSPDQYRPQAPHQPYDQTYPSPTLVQPCYAVSGTKRPPVPYPALFSKLGMSLSQTLWKLTNAGLLMLLAPRSLSQPIPPQFRMDLHWFGSSVTTNPLLAHTSHIVPLPAGDIHFMDFIEPDDCIHMLSWDDSEPEPIVVDESYESLFILSRDLDETVTHDVQYVIHRGRVMARAFKKQVKPRPLQRGDLVLKVIQGLIRDPRGKFRPNWSGPYFIRELTLEGTAWLMDLDGNRFSSQLM
ncbi:hypothetical protein CK203_062614 [Vitis vinifera]|uniref:Uncharacterized protein n=1 Tax=Vitis vinifera TaxID=29760 RepID=A0A438FZ34_VITVI|nr:hypothetical protein CK203_062614 [Vitis vinifera]